MSTAPKQHYTPDEFLKLEAAATEKHEYYRGEIFAMAGASPSHNRISGNIYWRVAQQLEGSPCLPNQSDVMVKVEATGLHTYPDVSVVCPPVQRATAPIEVVLNPKVLIEVLSPSTELYDRNVKFRHYQQVESVEEILLVLQDEPVIEHYRRQSADVWELTTISGLESEVMLRSVECRLTFAQIYANVEFPPTQHPLPPPPKLT